MLHINCPWCSQLCVANQFTEKAWSGPYMTWVAYHCPCGAGGYRKIENVLSELL